MITILIITILLLPGCANLFRSGVSVDQCRAAEYNVELAGSYIANGNLELAKRKLLLALRQNPDSAEAQSAMGYFLLITGQLKKAGAFYRRAIQLAPDSGSIQNNYGLFLCDNGNYHEAIKYFLLATANIKYLHPAMAFENAGFCEMKEGDESVAKGYFLNALRYDARRLKSLLALAEIYRKNGEGHKAREYIKRYNAVRNGGV